MYSIYISQTMFKPYSMYPQYYIGKNVEQNPVIPKTEIAVLNIMLYLYYECKLFYYIVRFEKAW